MTHEDIKILISAYVDGEVTPSEKNIAQEHLSSCVECQKEFKAYKAMSSSLSKWSNESLSPDQEIKIQKRFLQRREPMFTIRSSAVLACVVILFVIAGAGVETLLIGQVQGRLKSASDDI